MSASLRKQLQKALTDVMDDPKFRDLSQWAALDAAVEVADQWRDLLREIEDAEYDAS
jgi:hypothetical protein